MFVNSVAVTRPVKFLKIYNSYGLTTTFSFTFTQNNEHVRVLIPDVFQKEGHEPETEYFCYFHLRLLLTISLPFESL